MIIWLASYPRSGNTLLRTVIKQTMDIGSYSAHAMLADVGRKKRTEFGHLPLPCEWAAFYRQAVASSDVHLVKTHSPPEDQSPAIYVVRDGRLATESYLRLYEGRKKVDPLADAFTPTYADLVIGRDYYGDWSSHYRAWTEGRKNLILRYEDLVDPDLETLHKIATFIEYSGAPKPFENSRLDDPLAPEIKSQWTGSRSGMEAAMFLILHGELLVDLGYASMVEVRAAVNSLEPESVSLLRSAHECAKERLYWYQSAYEKEAVIRQLNDGKSNQKAWLKVLRPLLARR